MQVMTVENACLIAQTDYPAPTPQPHEVLVRVAYAGVNRADLYQVQGKYPPPEGASPLPGLEVSGEIVAMGSAVTGWSEGDLVCALLEGGGYAEYATVAASQLLPVPKDWSLREAGALPETLFTNWFALVQTAQLQSGENLLIHGGASGIGSFAISLAKNLGATVVVTVSTAEKAAFCLARGADKAILRSQFSSLTEQGDARSVGGLPPHSMDVILDTVGGDYMQKNLKLLRRGGRLVQLAFQQSAKAEMNMAPLLLNNLRWQGITLRSQPREFKAMLAHQIRQHCWPWLEDRSLNVPIHAEFPLTEAEKAHALMQQNLNLGKIVLKVAA